MTNGRKNKAHFWGALSPFCRKQVLIYPGILLSGCHCPLRCICQRFLKRKILSNGIIILKKIMLAELSVGPPLIIDSLVYIYHLSNVPPVFAFLFYFIKLYLNEDCSLGRLDHNLSKTGHEAPPVHRSHVQNGQRTVTEHQSSVPHRHIEPSGSNKFPYIWRRIEQNSVLTHSAWVHLPSSPHNNNSGRDSHRVLVTKRGILSSCGELEPHRVNCVAVCSCFSLGWYPQACTPPSVQRAQHTT